MPPPEQRLEADVARPGRVITDAVRVRLTSGRLITVLPAQWSQSGELCLVREISASTVAVRERRGWVLVHVRSGTGLAQLDRVYDAQLLLRLLDRHDVWRFGEGDAEALAAALGRCESIFANFDLRGSAERS